MTLAARLVKQRPFQPVHQCCSPISTSSTSTPSTNHRSPSPINESGSVILLYHHDRVSSRRARACATRTTRHRNDSMRVGNNAAARTQRYIIATHLSFPHLPAFLKCPVFETVAPLPHFSTFLCFFCIPVLVPELDRYLVILPCE